MKFTKKLMSVFLVLAILGTTLIGSFSLPVSAKETQEQDNEIVATNSIGRVLSSVLEESGEETGDLIHSVTVVDGVATMVFNTLTEDATAVIGIFDETTDELLLSQEAELYIDDNSATMAFDIASLPEFFVVKAFLLDENLEPLCKAFVSNEYTESYQEFLSKTTDDFDENYVINLDENSNENFVVVSDGAVVVTEAETNILISADEETGTYVFENIDEQITSLKPDDIFYFSSEENIITIKVASVVIDGTTATVTEAEAEVEEVFDYIKIDETAVGTDEDYQKADIGEGVTYLGESEDEASTFISGSVNEEVSASYNFKVKYEFNDNTSIEGTISATTKIEIKIYYDAKLWGKDYIESTMITTNTGKGSIKFEGKIELDNKKYYLAKVPLPVCVGVVVNVDISPVLEASASIEVAFSVTSKAGFIYSTTSGTQKINDKTCNYDFETEAEIQIKVGLKVEINTALIEFIKIGVSAEVAIEAVGTVETSLGNNDAIKHDCLTCINGDINACSEIQLFLKLGFDDLNLEVTPVNLKVTLSTKLSDFYWSLGYGEFGFCECPHKKYKVTFTILSSGQPVANAKVGSITSNNNGKAITYLASGKYSYDVSADNYISTLINFSVDSSKKYISIYMNKTSLSAQNVAPTGNAYSYSSSQWENHYPSNINDGDLDTCWQSNLNSQYPTPGVHYNYVGISFKKPISVTGITMLTEGVGDHAAGDTELSDALYPNGYLTQYYDGKNWHYIKMKIDGKTLSYSFSKPTTLYDFRLTITHVNKYPPRIYEISIIGSSYSPYSLATASLLSHQVAYSNAEEGNLPTEETIIAQQTATASFEHAIVGQEYLMVASLSDEFDALLSSENLLYISQLTAENSTVTFEYPEPTDTEGYHTYIFGPCDHDYSPVVSREATCTHFEEITYICANCSNTYAEETVLNPDNHEFALIYSVDTEPTSEADGTISRHCIYCDEASIDEANIPNLEIAEYDFSMENNFTLEYKVRCSILDSVGYTNAHIALDFGDTSCIISEYTVSDNYYVFKKAIKPSLMNKSATATLCANVGKTVLKSQSVIYDLDNEFWSVLNIGAQIRTNATDSSAYDMRFVTALDNDFFTVNSKDFEALGVILARADQLEAAGLDGTALTLDFENSEVITRKLSAVYLNNSTVNTDNYYMYYSTITGITSDAFDREYVAVAYCTVGGKTYYSNPVTRCVNNKIA